MAPRTPTRLSALPPRATQPASSSPGCTMRKPIAPSAARLASCSSRTSCACRWPAASEVIRAAAASAVTPDGGL